MTPMRTLLEPVTLDAAALDALPRSEFRGRRFLELGWHDRENPFMAAPDVVLPVGWGCRGTAGCGFASSVADVDTTGRVVMCDSGDSGIA